MMTMKFMNLIDKTSASMMVSAGHRYCCTEAARIRHTANTDVIRSKQYHGV
jgi:hypothetical protein